MNHVYENVMVIYDLFYINVHFILFYCILYFLKTALKRFLSGSQRGGGNFDILGGISNLYHVVGT